jgi:DNA replication protein DnaC
MTFLETLSNENQKSYNVEYFCKVDPFNSYFITGRAGIGKTFLAIQIVKDGLKRSPVAADFIDNRPNPDPNNLAPQNESQLIEFAKAQDIIRIARQQYSDSQEERIEAKYSIKAWKLRETLIIDDLGAEQTTEFAKAVMFDILDYRYDNKDNCQTIITSNVSLNELSRVYSDRTTSRINGMCLIVTPENQTDYRNINVKNLNKFL